MGVLFISHSTKNNDEAVKVRDWLRAKGWADVFLDLDPDQGLAPGQHWQEELQRAGANCSAVLVLISPDWTASQWCQTEFLVAVQLHKRIIPVMVAPTPIDQIRSDLRDRYQIADITTPDKEPQGFGTLEIGLKRAGLDPTAFDWPPPGEPLRPVYRGLQALDVADAAIFFGRDVEITKGLDDLRRMRAGVPERILVILGASGAGKSSFLRAGLLARLARDDHNFLPLPVIRPERAAVTGAQGLTSALSQALGRPVSLNGGAYALTEAFAELRAPVVDRLSRYAAASREVWNAKPPTIVIPIDQAEELFGSENLEREAFLDIVGGVLAGDDNAVVVATIRTDSYEPFQRGWLPRAQSVFSLPPLATSAFKEVIEGPAKLAKPPLSIAPDLTGALLADLDKADALPLLAFTLERLQARSKTGSLTLLDYQTGLGGLGGAIRAAVDDALGPKADAQALARKLFIPALVQVDQEGVKRRVAKLADIPPATRALAVRFVDQRLLVSDRRNIDGRPQESLEVAHEAILRQWPALESWIIEERDALSTLDLVRVAAGEWKTHSARPKAKASNWLVHYGERLKDASTVLKRADFAPLVTADMTAYLAACRKAELATRNARLVLAGIAFGALIVASALATQSQWKPQWDVWALQQTQFDGQSKRVAELSMLKPGEPFQDCRPTTEGKPSKLCPQMVVIPAGSFVMGSPESEAGRYPDEGPQHRVTMGRAFAVGKYDVTFDEWSACVSGGGCKSNPNPSDGGWGRGDRPVINVSWEDAQGYVFWLSKVTKQSYRLLTEAQWEYAARAGTDTAYSFGNDASQLGAYGWYDKNSNARTHPVGQKLPNGFGLYDVHGNVWQWVQDCYSNNYAGASMDGSANTTLGCDRRVLRGGSWGLIPQGLRAAYRIRDSPSIRYFSVGFRVARTLSPP